MEEIFTGLDRLPKDPNFVYGDTTGRLATQHVAVNSGLGNVTEGVASNHTLIKRSLQENLALKSRQYAKQKFNERNRQVVPRSSGGFVLAGSKRSLIGRGNTSRL